MFVFIHSAVQVVAVTVVEMFSKFPLLFSTKTINSNLIVVKPSKYAKCFKKELVT